MMRVRDVQLLALHIDRRQPIRLNHLRPTGIRHLPVIAERTTRPLGLANRSHSSRLPSIPWSWNPTPVNCRRLRCWHRLDSDTENGLSCLISGESETSSAIWCSNRCSLHE